MHIKEPHRYIGEVFYFDQGGVHISIKLLTSDSGHYRDRKLLDEF